jgi:hypothetical protein
VATLAAADAPVTLPSEAVAAGTAWPVLAAHVIATVPAAAPQRGATEPADACGSAGDGSGVEPRKPGVCTGEASEPALTQQPPSSTELAAVALQTSAHTPPALVENDSQGAAARLRTKSKARPCPACHGCHIGSGERATAAAADGVCSTSARGAVVLRERAEATTGSGRLDTGKYDSAVWRSDGSANFECARPHGPGPRIVECPEALLCGFYIGYTRRPLSLITTVRLLTSALLTFAYEVGRAPHAHKLKNTLVG